MTDENILIVDDTPANIQLLAEMLSQRGYAVRPINSGKRALAAARAMPPDLILLDINMPEMNGYEVCQHLKIDDTLRDIPVIFISAIDEVVDKVRAFQAGGVDYITKPFHLEEVLARVHTHLELRRHQLEIEQLRQREIAYLQQMNQLKDDVMMMVSHDLKNPLGVILAAMEMMEDALKVDFPEGYNSISYFVKMVGRAAKRMEYLIQDVLDLARVEGRIGLKRQSISLTHYLRDNLDDFTILAAERDITLNFNPPEEDVQISIDPKRFKNALDNLLSNALKYTNPGGRVELSGSVRDCNAVITVSDTGIGIPEEEIPYLFQKFYRVERTEHRTRSGSGLGMAIAKAVIEQHGGEILVTSKVGVGSEFVLVLPLAGS